MTDDQALGAAARALVNAQDLAIAAEPQAGPEGTLADAIEHRGEYDTRDVGNEDSGDEQAEVVSWGTARGGRVHLRHRDGANRKSAGREPVARILIRATGGVVRPRQPWLLLESRH